MYKYTYATCVYTRDLRIQRISDSTRRTKKIARIPSRNRNAFSYRTSLPRSISAEIYRSPEPISLHFTGIQKSRSASRNSIGKWGNSTLRYEPTVHRASDQRTITPKGIFTSGRMRATIGYSCGGFTFSLAAHRIMRFFFLSIFFFFLSFAVLANLAVLKRKNCRSRMYLTSRRNSK